MGIAEFVQAIILGAVQGVTEFLPISSTAHLLLVTQLFHWTAVGQKYYVDAIQFGSVIAVILYFGGDIRRILLGGWQAIRRRDHQSQEGKLLIGIAIGTIPALVVGFLVKDYLPDTVLVIAVMQLLMAGLLALAEQRGSRQRGLDSIRIWDGFWVGMGQMIALLPGASRSGSTLTAALFLGLERQAAARFSFLLGIPTLTIATLYQARKAMGNIDDLLLLVVGIVSAFIFSYLSIAWLMQYLQRYSTRVFILYRVGLGVLLLIGLSLGLFLTPI